MAGARADGAALANLQARMDGLGATRLLPGLLPSPDEVPSDRPSDPTRPGRPLRFPPLPVNRRSSARDERTVAAEHHFCNAGAG